MFNKASALSKLPTSISCLMRVSGALANASRAVGVGSFACVGLQVASAMASARILVAVIVLLLTEAAGKPSLHRSENHTIRTRHQPNRVSASTESRGQRGRCRDYE